MKVSYFSFAVHIRGGCGAVGSASEWHSEGQGFEPPQLHQKILQSKIFRAMEQ
jgi:hypothetical protein